MDSVTPFNNEAIRDWFFGSFAKPDKIPSLLLAEASGPFEKKDFTDFLKNLGFIVIDLDFFDRFEDISIFKHTINTMVMGGDRESWFAARLSKLENVIDQYSGGHIKIYSQEMFLSFMATGRDVFDESESFIRFMGQGNFALEYLSKLGFDWPSTSVTFGDGPFINEPFHPEGLLGVLGYRTGHSGIKDAGERRVILHKVFTIELSQLPKINSTSYMREWGQPNSSKRLKKMADSIASYCRNVKRKKSPPRLAIEHRESDLEWLKNKFYRGRFKFTWPSTDVY